MGAATEVLASVREAAQAMQARGQAMQAQGGAWLEAAGFVSEEERAAVAEFLGLLEGVVVRGLEGAAAAATAAGASAPVSGSGVGASRV